MWASNAHAQRPEFQSLCESARQPPPAGSLFHLHWCQFSSPSQAESARYSTLSTMVHGPLSSAAVCLSVTILPTGPSILPDGASRRLRSRRCASTKTAFRIVHSDGSATAGRAGRSSATVILARNRQESRRTYERRTFSGTDSQPYFVRGRRTTWSHNATIPACLNALLPSR